MRASTWIALGAIVCVLLVGSCCCLGALVGVLAPEDEVEPAPVESAPASSALPLQVEVPVPVHPLCASFDPGTLPSLDREARIDLDVVVDDTSKPTVVVRHNLPLGTVIAVDISEGDVAAGTALATDGRYNDGSEIAVEAPCFVAGPFRAVPPGRYTASAVTPALMQPPHIESILGPNHQRLRGPQVHTVIGVRIVRASQRVRVGRR